MKKKILCILIVLILGVISTLSIYQYNKLDSNKENKVNDVTDSSTLALVLVEGYGDEATESALTEFPDASTHYLDFAKSYCDNGATIGWDNENNKVRIVADKANSCKLYFREGNAANPKTDILARNTLVTTIPDFNTSATDTNTNIYQAEDDLGTSYYFRGASTNNYVKFGKDTTNTDMYWRIIRINGDGSIRMIYDGTAAVANGTEHTAAISTGSYNTTYGPKYVGYTYDVDGTETDSNIKSIIDTWYESSLKNAYGVYIADSIFCNDREIGAVDENGRIEYAPLDRVWVNSNPKLTCTQGEDRYTVNESNGNGLLKYPIGLITADEAMFAGGTTASLNTSYYLYFGDYFWSMSPSGPNDTTYTYVMEIDVPVSSVYGGTTIDQEEKIRPVINLRTDLLFTGSGTQTDPYKVAGFE